MVPFIEIIRLVSNFMGVLLLIRQGVPRKMLANSVALTSDKNGSRTPAGTPSHSRQEAMT